MFTTLIGSLMSSFIPMILQLILSVLFGSSQA